MAIHKYYQVSDNSLSRTRQFCPRCGDGYFLAEHEDRLTCGKCSYTEFKK